ncbi:branched-chain amino acid ABC transporter permease [Xanthobacter tagetidis]|uniref:Branched-chain amino acid ABC transporter permease n=1 Tax=Xanthobacter tagetidis TaxID=60216 RepID=A0A3L7AEC6_9HYPH|nr:branched-chain amino acid ABC transporter permease [Xanthobacter tagetidis]MBB6309824.1 branched-chain amino acid transport system permease protein [Xanthobacter tagetidis]RLP78150.1 branched-chain amino acid ABC transporter permease [Xanthobacter tagetidis]
MSARAAGGGAGFAFLFRPAVLIALFALALAVAVWSGSGYAPTIIARTAILALAAVSLSFLIGQAGLVSFGHAAPLGIGAYAVLIAGEYGVTNALVLFPLGFAAAALWSAATGVIALRTRGVYFIMITLAFAQMLFYVAGSLSAFGGDDGLGIAARATFFGQRFLRTDTDLAVFAIAALGVTLLVLERLSAAPFGLMLRTGRANEEKLASLGLDPFVHRLVALAAAGGIAGIAGVLLANQVEYVSPATMNWHVSGELIVMVVLGGTKRLGGAVLGAVAVMVIDETLGHFTEFWKFGLGLVILGAVLLRGADLTQLIRGTAHG